MKNYYRKVKAIFQKGNDLTTQQGRASEREKRIILTSLAAAVSQVLSMAVPLITVRVSLNYMGSEIYGLWMAVTTFFALFTFADLGLGNGLQTELSRLMGKKNFLSNARVLVSSSYVMLLSIAMVILAIFFIAFPMVNWGEVVNAQSKNTAELSRQVVLAIFIPKIIGIPISLIRRNQAALQEGFISYVWQIIANILSVISIYIVVILDMGVITLILVSSIIPLIVTIFNTFQYYLKRHPELTPKIKHFDFQKSVYMFRLSIGFFIISILNTIGLNIDNYIVARIANLESVTTFSIASRATQLINVACTIISSPLWAANGEALARGDYFWVAKTTRKMSLISMGITMMSSIIMLISGPTLFEIWLGYDINISFRLLAGLLLMQILLAFISPYFMVLNGAGKVKIQIYVFLIYSLFSTTLKFIFGYCLGIESIPYIGSLCYAIIVIFPVYYTVRKICSNNKYEEGLSKNV
ncbi:lipopolysaccharide biosynthesis protein [Bacillus canaveralius]|uniref:lipopolysaccharide biosynthesis protein n=1 Tax=Bacillus canaveralius TaxID=1403243 RepID=UPI0015E08FD6|nr:lipopolysaccharide biosynthesis protein [Bacillus canaveralius]